MSTFKVTDSNQNEHFIEQVRCTVHYANGQILNKTKRGGERERDLECEGEELSSACGEKRRRTDRSSARE